MTVDATVLCIKSGNAIVLKGGSDALETNKALVEAIKEALPSISDAVTFIDSTDRNILQELLQLRGIIDVVIHARRQRTH